jgi:hypothetical protein
MAISGIPENKNHLHGSFLAGGLILRGKKFFHGSIYSGQSNMLSLWGWVWTGRKAISP